MTEPLLPFVRLELEAPIGLPAGRYRVAVPEGSREAESVLVVGADGGSATKPPPRTRIRGRGARGGSPGATVVTHVRSGPRIHAREADALLTEIRASGARRSALLEETLSVLNRALRAHRVAALDPYVAELTRFDARRVQIGVGRARDLARGRFERAAEADPLPHEATGGRALEASRFVAAVLAGRESVLAPEEHVLRALLDSAQGRSASAAIELCAALELSGWAPGCGDDLRASLATAGPPAEALRARAVSGSLAVGDAERLATLAVQVAGMFARDRERRLAAGPDARAAP